MPYCSQCGTSLAEEALYCRQCGAQQPTGAASGAQQPAPKPLMSPRTAAVLCYFPFAGWIAALYVLGSQRFRGQNDVRFHAFQGLYLFVVWLLIDWAPWFGPLRPLRHPLQLLVIVASVFMMVKASRAQRYSLPVLGGLAERSL